MISLSNQCFAHSNHDVDFQDLTYSFQTYVFDSDRTSMTKWVLEVWSVRRFRAWRRGLMQPIWQVMSRICPLQRPFHNKVQRVGEPQVTTSHR